MYWHYGTTHICCVVCVYVIYAKLENMLISMDFQGTYGLKVICHSYRISLSTFWRTIYTCVCYILYVYVMYTMYVNLYANIYCIMVLLKYFYDFSPECCTNAHWRYCVYICLVQPQVYLTYLYYICIQYMYIHTGISNIYFYIMQTLASQTQILHWKTFLGVKVVLLENNKIHFI